MTAIKGLGITGNGAGVTTPLDMKIALSGLITKTALNTARPGLFWGGTPTIVSGTAGMAYSVIAYTCASTRGATAGVVLGGNDGTIASLATTAAPGSNSRYDVVYHWQREFTIDGVDSNPVIGVIQGTASGSPTVPSLAAFPGAIELARILVPTGVTATNSGTTITQTAPFTALDGGVVQVRNTTDLGTYTPLGSSARARDIATGVFWRWNGTTWGVEPGPGAYARRIRTAGTLILNSTTWANITTWDSGTTIVLPAAAGDVIEVSLSGLSDTEAVFAFLNVVTGGGNGFGPNGVSARGILGWSMGSGTVTAIGTSFFYTCVAGDIASSQVTLTLQYRTLTAANKTLFATADIPLVWFARNHGQIG